MCFESLICQRDFWSTNKTSLIIEDRMIELEKLGADSSSRTLLNTVKEKIFAENAKIKDNLIGVTTDNVSSLQGNHSGMVTLLKAKYKLSF